MIETVYEGSQQSRFGLWLFRERWGRVLLDLEPRVHRELIELVARREWTGDVVSCFKVRR